MLPLSASAQEAESAGQVEQSEVEAGEAPHFAEEVTVAVTARKREENLQSVPFSVVAPTEQALRNRGAESIQDISANVAGAVNVPLGPAAAARVTAYNTAVGGFIDAVQPDQSIAENVDSGQRTGARVALRVEPNERFAFTPRFVYQDVGMDGWNGSMRTTSWPIPSPPRGRR